MTWPQPLKRWERLVMRRPGLAYSRLQAVMAQDTEPPFQALLGAFFILERWGRGPELQGALESALLRARQHRLLEEAAELSEALGRLHYQRGDYVQACNVWSQTLELADDETRWACLARIGLAHLCFALGDWARGGRVLDQAELHYPQLADDAYLRAKIALNRAVALRATQGPQAALPRLDEARAAAREAGHRDYEAEAIWHLARCARDSGAAGEALALAVQAEELASRCHYRWLQAQTLLLISELRPGTEAIPPAEQALLLGEALQSRAVQAAAHGRLSQLMAEQAQLGPSWYHQQQRQRLEATLVQTELPARLEQLARFDTDPHGADALLLSLGRADAPASSMADVDRHWQRARPPLKAALSLSMLEVSWKAPLPGRGRTLPYDPPQVLELPLHQPDGEAIGVLRLERPVGVPWSRADRSRATRVAGWLERLVAQAASASPAPMRDAPMPEDTGQQARVLLSELERLRASVGPLEPIDLADALLAARRLVDRLG
ncbi:hypothetical protein [Roseateles amylovorans]|uniref:Tetratricopeptide repeat protein n=1 Tax=Roseateles amylovorans TaxID=2978473 RepID=A0ABY6B486_9BURK|nr:hypothetical protein [Roseateles amylovorans]UXH79541.1 hypothetical protein N4261_06350 [Roseateles amylovorans]